MINEVITVSEFNALLNQTLNFAYPEVVVEGEVASYKVNQGKWVFFDLKDESSVVSCFMPIFQLKTQIEDGMKIRVKSVPQLTKWGKFSLTVREIELAGEGSVKKAFELLKAKLQKEGLFDDSRKRALPTYPGSVLLITSKQAAAFNDFIAILNDRWGGVSIDHLQVQVQGETASGQIISAIEHANQNKTKYDVVVLIRGGGSAEDLQTFNLEDVVRTVFASTVPIVVGIGHEDDISLAELAADVRAATPTDAARRLVPDKNEVLAKTNHSIASMRSAIEAIVVEHRSMLSRYYHSLEMRVLTIRQHNGELVRRSSVAAEQLVTRNREHTNYFKRMLAGLDPSAILTRGYSIARVNGNVLKNASEFRANDLVMLQLHQGELELELKSAKAKSNDQEQITIEL